MLVIVIGAIIGAIVAPMVWNSIRPDDIDIAQAITSRGTEDADDEVETVPEVEANSDRSNLVLLKSAGPTDVPCRH